MQLMKFSSPLLFIIMLVTLCSEDASAQRLKWKRSKPETLYARNKKKQVTPIYIGIGTKTPTAQLHVIGSMRFEGLQINNTLNSVVAVDGNGNLFWRDISNTNANAWFLSGNSINATNFLGTTNNQDLRIRTNNIQRAVITSSGSIGIGTTTPTAQFHTNGSVRFEGLLNDNTASRIISVDNNGNLSWRDAASLAGAGGWLLNGNNVGAANFLGTTSNEDLRIRTNNVQRAVFTTSGALGLGVAIPTAQLHTSGTVRFEGIANDNTLQRLALFDNNGNLFYRDLTSLQSNFWSLTGNTGTNPATNFIGTSDNNRLVFRANNTEKMTILPDGKIGIGLSNPKASLHVTSGAGSITAFPYETAVFEKPGDAKLAVLSSDNTGVGGASITLGHSSFSIGGLFPGYEMQYGSNNQRYLRFNYLPRNSNGAVQGEVSNILIMTDNSRVGVNLGPAGGGPTPNFPTANLHTKGTVRLEGLANGTGNPVVADANGNLFIGTAGTSTGWLLTGNGGTNPSSNFLGTTDNNKLSLRTNNLERITVLADGKVGINNANPSAQLVINSSVPDNHVRIQGVAPSITFEGSPGPNNEGRIGYATIPNNYVIGSIPGDLIVQTLGATSNLIFGIGGGGTGNGIERMRINQNGFLGISTQAPTAVLHTNGTVRFQNLPTGTGNAVVMDANGNLFKSNTLVGRSEQELSELKDEVGELKKEIESLKSVINSMKGGMLSVNENSSAAVLYQNAPNPFNRTTTIKYFLPEDVKVAILQVSDLQGKVLQTYNLPNSGNQYLNIDGGKLSAGTYIYTLFIEGRRIDSKKMVLTN